MLGFVSLTYSLHVENDQLTCALGGFNKARDMDRGVDFRMGTARDTQWLRFRQSRRLISITTEVGLPRPKSGTCMQKVPGRGRNLRQTGIRSEPARSCRKAHSAATQHGCYPTCPATQAAKPPTHPAITQIEHSGANLTSATSSGNNCRNIHMYPSIRVIQRHRASSIVPIILKHVRGVGYLKNHYRSVDKKWYRLQITKRLLR